MNILDYQLKIFRSGKYTLKPFEPKDFENDEMPSIYFSGLYHIFSNPTIYKDNEHVKIESKEQAIEKLKLLCSASESYPPQNFNYWIICNFEDGRKRLVGNINLIPISLLALSKITEYDWLEFFVGKRNYRKFWAIEFYVDPAYQKLGLASVFTQVLIDNFFEQGGVGLFALVYTENIASRKVLEKTGFIPVKEYETETNQMLYIKSHLPILPIEYPSGD